MNITKDTVIAVVGLGYVGLPLAVEFGRQYKTIGFDLSEPKLESYKQFIDPTGQVSTKDFRAATKLTVTIDPLNIRDADIVIVAVPTPVDEAHTPDFNPLISSSMMVGQYLKRGAIVVYESTVYPGATEEVCIPVLEKNSGMKWLKDFNVGYSPERVNPGDWERTITKIVKVVSGDNPETLRVVGDLYASVITAGVHYATSIRVAEAAKVIENTQRDVNIALMNEFAIIFNKMGIDTNEVLEAAGTKWNFLPFRPGLVGGHCIGVDPYYLTHKAEMLGYHPEVILAGRRINDGMAGYIAQQTIKQLIKLGTNIKGAKVIIFGLTFKENCADLRNSKVADLVVELKNFGCDVYVHDPVAASKEARDEYQIELIEFDKLPDQVDAVIAAVGHKEYINKPASMLLNKLKKGGLFVDIKSSYLKNTIASSGYVPWRL